MITESFRKVSSDKSDEIPCMPPDIHINEWNQTSISNTASRIGSSSARAASTQSLNPSNRFLSRFSLIPGNISFRLSRTTSLGSSRPCPVSPATLTIFNDEDDLNLHPGPTGGLVNQNEARQCANLLSASFVNQMPSHCYEDASISLGSNAPASGSYHNSQNNSTSSMQDVTRDGDGAREGSSLNLFSPRILAGTENAETRHYDRRNGAREPVDRNVRFSRTLSVGRLRDRVLRRSTVSDFTFCPLQQDRDVRDGSQDNGRQAGERDSRVLPSDSNTSSSPSTSGIPSSLFGIQDYEVESSRSREARYHDLLEHRTNFLERRRRIRSQVCVFSHILFLEITGGYPLLPSKKNEVLAKREKNGEERKTGSMI